MKKSNRREFLNFISRHSAGLALTSVVAPSILAQMGCSQKSIKENSPFQIPKTPVVKTNSVFFPHLGVTKKNDLILVPGLNYHILASDGDQINSKGEKFGSHNDFLGFIPFDKKNPDEGYLWVNHEYFDPAVASGYDGKSAKTLQQIESEQQMVGGSLLHIKKNPSTKKWQVENDSSINRRWTGQTPIEFSAKQKILNQNYGYGTLGNCCGGVTPWDTFLTCEENYHHFYGEVSFGLNDERQVVVAKNKMAWDSLKPQPPEHYGWVVEIDPRTQKSQKHLSLGRFAHEGATVVQAKNGCSVVYMGDDASDQYFYKFVASKPNQLSEGTLYVAQFTPGSEIAEGRWIPLDVKNNKDLKKKFKNQLSLLIRTREAAKLVGATPLDRPEDCEVDPMTGSIYLNCTNNIAKDRPHGLILKFSEKNNNFLATEFTVRTFLKGGDETGFSCPDNLTFDHKGNLWLVSDMPVDDDASGLYKDFGNNSLFYIPMSGDAYGQVFRFASAPAGAELTGIVFAPDKQTLFCSIQHPTKEWPHGPGGQARSSVVAIQGSLIDKLLSF